MEDTLLQGLNPQQKEAVLATEGRIRIVAGAGAGKTKTLAHRFAYLVDKIGISPAHILCLSFTNKAASEMRVRIKKMVDESNTNDFISTIHGFCVKILRRDIYRLGFTSNFIILDEEDRKAIAKKVIEELELDTTVKNLLSDIELGKQGGGYIEQFDRSHDRFLCIDDTVYHIGASLKDLGKKWFAFNRMEQTTDELLSKM